MWPKGTPFIGPGCMGIVNLFHDGEPTDLKLAAAIASTKASLQSCNAVGLEPLCRLILMILHLLIGVPFLVHASPGSIALTHLSNLLRAYRTQLLMGVIELMFFWILNPWWDLIMLTFFAMAGAMWQNCGMCHNAAGMWSDDTRNGDGSGNGDAGVAGSSDGDDDGRARDDDDKKGWPFNKGAGQGKCSGNKK